MKFKKLKLYTDKLDLEKKFYTKTLGFSIKEESLNSFSIEAGWSELSFEKSVKAHIYHYCFLIPTNRLEQALEWMEKRVDIMDIKNGRKTQHFKTWNADSFYFYDASGNIAEFIVRYDLKNEDNADFDISKILAVNEMGMPTNDVLKINNQLESELETKFWKGGYKRFGTNGSQEGIFLLPNYNLKDVWFPTSIKLKPEPFEAIIENKGKEYFIEYKEQKLKTTPQ